MMFLLIRDVLLNRRPRGGAYGECRIAFLPGKGSQADLLMHPCRGSLFQLTHDVRQTMSRFQADQKVDMIGHAADALRKSTEARNDSSQILVHARTPFRRDDGLAIPRRKDEMVMEAQIGGSHVAFLQFIGVLRHRRDFTPEAFVILRRRRCSD